MFKATHEMSIIKYSMDKTNYQFKKDNLSK